MPAGGTQKSNRKTDEANDFFSRHFGNDKIGSRSLSSSFGKVSFSLVLGEWMIVPYMHVSTFILFV